MRSIALSAALTLIGCGSPPPPSTAAPQPVATPTSSTLPSPPDPEPLRPAVSVTATASKEAPTGTPEPSFKEAMTGILACDRAEDGLRLESPELCLLPARRARAAILEAASESGSPEERLAPALKQLLDHPEPTVVMYTLMEHQAYLRATPETVHALESLLKSPLEPVAEAAATARLALRDAPARETRSRALSMFSTHLLRRVRHAACRHLGLPVYKGDQGVFKALIAAANNSEIELLIRSCAAREAGHIATARDLKTLIGLLDTLDIQQSALVGLRRGLGTAKAIAAYVRWFDRHATQPAKIHWTAMHVFLPWDTGLERMPREATLRVLSRIAAHREHTSKVRALAIEGLIRLKAKAALEDLRKAASPDDSPEVLKALGG
jgi:hypothetical protein